MKTATVKISTTHEKFGKVEVEVEVPQIESFEEAATFHNGADKALDFHNNAVATNAGNGARAVLRGGKADTVEALIENARKVAREYSPQTAAAGTSQKAKAAKFDEVKALLESGKELTREQLLEMLMASK